MGRPPWAALGAAVVAVAPLLLSPAAPAVGDLGLVPRIVGLDPDAPVPAAALTALGATLVRVDATLDFAVVAAPDGGSFDAAARLLPGVAYVEPDHVLQAFGEPGADGAEPLQPLQWGLAKVRAAEAWPLLDPDADKPRIAVLDTGVDWHHHDLAEVVWDKNGLHGDDLTLYAAALTCALKGAGATRCFYLQQPPEELLGPMDYSGHGTHVAGIAAATRDGAGVAGVAPAQVHNIKVLPSSASVWSLVDVLSTGIAVAANDGADVISMSVGCWCESQSLQRAVTYAWLKGSVLVAAAGNFDSDVPVYPAAFREVISVAATNPQDGRWVMAPGVGSSYGPEVDLAAPGEAVLSDQGRWMSLNGVQWVGAGYRNMSGTSMATPHVAGVAALVQMANPDLTNAQVREVLEETARDLGAAGRDDSFGHGLVDAFAAVQAAKALVQPGQPGSRLLAN